MICTLCTRALGFVRIAIISAIFGDKGNADVLNVVFNIPNSLRKLFAEGALSAAFIPAISKALIEDETKAGAVKIARNLLAAMLLVLVPLVIGCIVFAEPIIRVLAPFPDTAKQALAIDLFRFVSGYILFISIAAIFMGVLNANDVFVPPALVPLMFSITVIGSLLLFHNRLGIFALAVGIIAGGVAQILFLIPFYKNKGFRLTPDFNFNNPPFKSILQSYFPIVGSAIVVSINQLIANALASGLEDGSITALTNSLTLLQFPYGIFSASIITVMYPRMSRQVVNNDHEGLRESLSHGINFIMILLVPAAIGYMLFGKEIVALFFQRMKFTARGSSMAGQVLFYYSIGLFSLGAYSFFQRFLYAFKDYMTPFFVSLGIVVIDVALSVWWKETPLRVSGLALANSAAFTAGLVALIIAAKKRLGRINGKSILVNALKVAVSMAVMTGLLLLYKHFVAPHRKLESSLKSGIFIAGAVGIGGVSTLIMYLVTRVDIVNDYVKRKLKR